MGVPILRPFELQVLIFTGTLDRIKMPNKPVDKGDDLMVCHSGMRKLCRISLKNSVSPFVLSSLQGTKAACLKES
jgi:hypothetical protein